MEEFKTKVISTVTNPPTLWKRYVDDTFVIQDSIFWNISTLLTLTYNLLQRTPILRDLCLFGTLVTPGSGNTPLKTVRGNWPSQTSTYIGPTTASFLPGLVCLTLTHMLQELLVQIHSSGKKGKRRTSRGVLQKYNLWIGQSIGSKSPTSTSTTTYNKQTKIRTATSTWCYPKWKD